MSQIAPLFVTARCTSKLNSRRLTLGCSRRGPQRSCLPRCAIIASRSTRLNPWPLYDRRDMARNLLVIAGAVIVGVLVMQPFMVADQLVSEGRTFQGVGGWVLMQAISLAAPAAAAAAIGTIAAIGVKTLRPGPWAAAVGGTVACLLVLAQRYVAADWLAWLGAIVHVTVPSAVAWCLFLWVWNRRNVARPVV